MRVCWLESMKLLGFINAHKARKTVLFHLLKDFGFNSDSIQNILEIKEINKIFNIFKKEIRIDNKKLAQLFYELNLMLKSNKII